MGTAEWPSPVSPDTTARFEDVSGLDDVLEHRDNLGIHDAFVREARDSDGVGRLVGAGSAFRCVLGTSSRASEVSAWRQPCQGWGRGFESRRPLHTSAGQRLSGPLTCGPAQMRGGKSAESPRARSILRPRHGSQVSFVHRIEDTRRARRRPSDQGPNQPAGDARR